MSRRRSGTDRGPGAPGRGWPAPDGARLPCARSLVPCARMAFQMSTVLINRQTEDRARTRAAESTTARRLRADLTTRSSGPGRRARIGWSSRKPPQVVGQLLGRRVPARRAPWPSPSGRSSPGRGGPPGRACAAGVGSSLAIWRRSSWWSLAVEGGPQRQQLVERHARASRCRSGWSTTPPRPGPARGSCSGGCPSMSPVTVRLESLVEPRQPEVGDPELAVGRRSGGWRA